MKRLILLMLCLIIFGVVACQGASSDSVAAVNEATDTAVPTTVVPTNTPLPSATPTNRPTQTPTATPRPTETTTPTPTLTPSPLPSPTVSLWESDLVEQSADFQIVDQLGGRINTVTVQDGIAYVGVGPRLWMLDVSRPDTPIELGKSDILPELIQYIAVFGNTAYVLTTDESGFWIIDVSQPHNPQIRNFFETSVPVYFLRIWNERLYVGPTSREADSFIFSLEDPFTPILIGYLPKEFYPVSDTDYVYSQISKGENKTIIQVFNASQLDQIQFVNEIPVDLEGFVIGDDQDKFYFHTFRPDFAFWVIEEIDSNYRTKKLEDAEPNPTLDSIHIENDYLYMFDNWTDGGDYGSYVSVFDVSNPDRVREIDGLRIGNRYYDYITDDNMMYIAAGEKLIIAEINREKGLEVTAGWSGLGDLDWIDSNTEYIFALNYLDNHIYQLEISSSQTLDLQSGYQGRRIGEALLAGNEVFTAGWFTGIHRYQVDGVSWEEMATFTKPPGTEFVDSMNVHEGYLYAILDGDLGIFDISEPDQILQIGELESFDYRGLGFDSEILFYWESSNDFTGLQTISIADPANPTPIGRWTDPLNHQNGFFLVDDGFVYLMSGGFLRVINVTDPTNMFLVATLPLDGPTSVRTIWENKLVLGGDLLRVVDISDPTRPEIIGEFDTPGYVQDVTVVDNHLYIADGAGGLLILKPKAMDQNE